MPSMAIVVWHSPSSRGLPSPFRVQIFWHLGIVQQCRVILALVKVSIKYVRYIPVFIFLLFYFSILSTVFIIFALLLQLPPVRNSGQGPHSAALLPPPRYGTCRHFFLPADGDKPMYRLRRYDIFIPSFSYHTVIFFLFFFVPSH